MARIIEGKQKNIIGSKLKELRIKKGHTATIIK